MKKMTQEQFNKWVNKMCKEYDNSSFCARLCEDGRTLFVISKHGNRIGKAIWHENDKFDICIGTAIAYARAIGQEIPTIIVKVRVDSLNYGDEFIFQNNHYVYVAKHPTKSNVHIATLERNDLLCEFMGDTLIEKC